MIPTYFETTYGGKSQRIDWRCEVPAVPYDRAVLVLYGSDGLAPTWKPGIDQHARALADLGILAVIPDYFQKAPAVSHNNSIEVFSQVISRHDEWASVLRDAVLAVKNLPGVDSNRIGLLGFSLGGFLALRIRDTVACLVEYFAPFRFPTTGPLVLLEGIGLGPNPNLNAHIHHGEVDSFVPLKLHANRIESSLQLEHAKVSHSYFPGAGHGFLGTDPENTNARKLSLEGTVKFFDTHL